MNYKGYEFRYDMENHTQGGLHKLKAGIIIQAPAELCYREWVNLSQLSKYLYRVIEMQTATQAPALERGTNPLPMNTTAPSQPFGENGIHHWTLRGPQGKIYQVQNKTILDIPNRFYCMSSTDSEDISSQLSVLFSADDTNQTTYMEMEASSWLTENMQLGRSTQLFADIINADDTFLQDCLQDFKHHVESIRSQSG